MVIADTDILIDITRGVKTTADLVDQLKSQEEVAISAITYMELVVGCRNKVELSATEAVTSDFDLVHVSDSASRVALQLVREYRLSHGLLISDALIAATVLVSGGRILTRNRRHFQTIPGLEHFKKLRSHGIAPTCPRHRARARASSSYSLLENRVSITNDEHEHEHE